MQMMQLQPHQPEGLQGHAPAGPLAQPHPACPPLLRMKKSRKQRRVTLSRVRQGGSVFTQSQRWHDQHLHPQLCGYRGLASHAFACWMCSASSPCAIDMDWQCECDWLTYDGLISTCSCAMSQYMHASSIELASACACFLCLSISHTYKVVMCRAKPSTACWKVHCQGEGVEHSHAWGRDNADSYAPWLEECRVWRRLRHSGQEGRQRRQN